MSGDVDYASAAQKATKRSLTVMEMIAWTDQFRAAGQSERAISLYQTWIDHNQDDLLLYAVYFNYGILLNNAGKTAEAAHALEQAIRIHPDFLPPYINLGGIYETMRGNPDALNQWYQIVDKLQSVNKDNITYK